MSVALDHAIEAYRQQRIFAQADAAYAALQADPKAWAEELEKRRLWDETPGDGLEDDPGPAEDEK